MAKINTMKCILEFKFSILSATLDKEEFFHVYMYTSVSHCQYLVVTGYHAPLLGLDIAPVLW